MNTTEKTILIVDDDVSITSAMAIRLAAEGYSVLTANDGLTARALAAAEPPDLIIADILMPVGTGFAMSQRLRRTATHTPVIFITASRDPELRKAATDFGGAGFIEKPYEAETLLQAVTKALDPLVTTTRVAVTAGAGEYESNDRRRILVVEDDPRIGMSLSIRLKAAGYEVAVASSATTAANSVVMLWPDLILMDITLPDGDGCQLAAQIKKLIPAKMPIIFITASKEPGLREHAMASGGAAFFEKPFNAAELLAAIQSASERLGRD